MYEDLNMDVKGEYLGAGSNPLSTALERVRSLSSRVLTYNCIFVPLPCNATAVCQVWHKVLCSIFCTIFLIGLRKKY